MLVAVARRVPAYNGLYSMVRTFVNPRYVVQVQSSDDFDDHCTLVFADGKQMLVAGELQVVANQLNAQPE
jgi:hypothetical protein